MRMVHAPRIDYPHSTRRCSARPCAPLSPPLVPPSDSTRLPQELPMRETAEASSFFFLTPKGGKLFLPPFRRRCYRYASDDTTGERQGPRLTSSLRPPCRVSTSSREHDRTPGTCARGGRRGPCASVIDASFNLFFLFVTRFRPFRTAHVGRRQNRKIRVPVQYGYHF